LSLLPVNAAIISLVPQESTVLLGDNIVIDVKIDSSDLISTGAMDLSYLSGLVGFSSFVFGPDVDNTLSGAPDSTTAGELDDFNFTSANSDGVTAGTLATITFTTGSSIGTADFDVLLETVFFAGPAWFWGSTGDSRQFKEISSADLASFTFNGTSVNVNNVPIPSTILLLGGGLAALVGLRRRRSS
jgi:hypothetical protein